MLKNVQLMQEINTKDIKLRCYNLMNSEMFSHNYGIGFYDRKTNETNYAYFSDLKDMFFYYDMIRNNLTF